METPCSFCERHGKGLHPMSHALKESEHETRCILHFRHCFIDEELLGCGISIAITICTFLKKNFHR